MATTKATIDRATINGAYGTKASKTGPISGKMWPILAIQQHRWVGMAPRQHQKPMVDYWIWPLWWERPSEQSFGTTTESTTSGAKSGK